MKIQPGSLHTTKIESLNIHPLVSQPSPQVYGIPWYTYTFGMIFINFVRYVYQSIRHAPKSSPVNMLHPMDPPVLQDLDPIPPIRREHT